MQACNASGCVDSGDLLINRTLEEAIGYFISSPDNNLGSSVALSADGNTRAVPGGVFFRSNGTWELQATLGTGTVSLSSEGNTLVIGRSFEGDGNTLAVRAVGESSSAIGVNGNQIDNAVGFSGATYVFVQSNNEWLKQA